MFSYFEPHTKDKDDLSSQYYGMGGLCLSICPPCKKREKEKKTFKNNTKRRSGSPRWLRVREIVSYADECFEPLLYQLHVRLPYEPPIVQQDPQRLDTAR